MERKDHELAGLKETNQNQAYKLSGTEAKVSALENEVRLSANRNACCVLEYKDHTHTVA